MPPQYRRLLLPRHLKGYLWICFLVFAFSSLALYENGIPLWRWKVQASGQPLPFVSPSHHDTVVQTAAYDGTTSTTLDPNDVVILVKTGATALWRRLPMHFSTTLGNPNVTPNFQIYSDSADNIIGYPVIDLLANASDSLKASPDFDLYRRVKEIRDANLYLESGSMEGDHYLPGGWRLDKYKFLPLFAHAQRNWPSKRWYIYMEDDNYYFWETLYSWLATHDHTLPLLLGAAAFRLGEDFVHGGSGFAVSQGALAKTFGADPNLVDKFEDYTKEQCCGDHILSHAMHSMGVTRYVQMEDGGSFQLQSLPIYRIPFGSWNWCSPLMNIHKVHQMDISQLYVFEKWLKEVKGSHRVRYRDVFEYFFTPRLNVTERSEWDNYASIKTYSSSQELPAGEHYLSGDSSRKPWFSKKACRDACQEWDECLSWKYADDACSLSHSAAMGQRIDAGIRMESGWMIDRIQRLGRTECKELGF